MRRVLVADDSGPMRTTLRMLLEASAGVEVFEAADGIEALRVLDGSSIDVLICDLEMPKLDGRKLIRILDARRGGPQVIVISGSAPPRAGEWKDGSVVGWLEKPFDTDELVALVDGGLPTQTGS